MVILKITTIFHVIKFLLFFITVSPPSESRDIPIPPVCGHWRPGTTIPKISVEKNPQSGKPGGEIPAIQASKDGMIYIKL
jgi:hypothetical protein